MAEYKDRVKDQTTTTGTGSFTLASTAPTGFRTFADAFTDGATVRYSVASSTQTEWEVGEGVWSAGALSLSRDTIYASSNAGAKVSFSAGTKTITVGPVAQDLTDMATKSGTEDLSNKTLVNPGGKYQTLTDATTVNWNCSGGQIAYLTLGGNRTIAAPTNMKQGTTYFLFLIQDSIGSRKVFWNSAFKWAAATAPTLTTTPGAVDIVHMMTDGTDIFCAPFAFNLNTSATTPPPDPEEPTTASLGHNLAGMEWVYNIKISASTRLNMNWSPPRPGDIKTIASWNYPNHVNRLPIAWEMVQPILLGSPANSTVLTAEGVTAAGDLHPGMVAYIRHVLDEHAANGITCVLDIHNYGRFRDYIYQPDGSVTGYVATPDAYTRPYTSSANTVERIMAKVVGGTAYNGTTISMAQFNDLWEKLATEFMGHAGLAGYGLMNEPYNMPDVGGVVESAGTQDYTIWNDFAESAVQAIRAIDTTTPIYVSGNNYSTTMDWADNNPNYPLIDSATSEPYENVIYEGHVYADSTSSGQRFDWDNEATMGYSAGESGATGITVNTMYNRVVDFVTWCNAEGVSGWIGETGMPTNEGNLSNDRWATQFKVMLDYLYANNIGVACWMHGSFWTAQNWAVNATINWHNNKPVEPAISGMLKAVAGVDACEFFASADKAWGVAGTVLTIRVWGRGYLANARSFTVTSDNGGTLSTTSVTVPAGYNPKATFTYTTASERKATLTFTGTGAPWPVVTYSHATPANITNTYDAAMAICARYDAAKWEMQHAYTDYNYNNGTLITAADLNIRAVRDSGYATKQNNIYDLKSWWSNDDDLPAGVTKHPHNPDFTVPVSDLVNGRVVYHGESASEECAGLWNKKRIPVSSATKTSNTDPSPQDKALYHLNDDFFQVVAFRTGASSHTSEPLVTAQYAEGGQYASIRFSSAGALSLRFKDGAGTVTTITGSTPTASAHHRASCRFTAGSQIFRVDGTQVGATTVTPSSSTYFDTITVGTEFTDHFLRGSFTGHIFGVITGKGAPTSAELAVLENYLASLGV